MGRDQIVSGPTKDQLRINYSPRDERETGSRNFVTSRMEQTGSPNFSPSLSLLILLSNIYCLDSYQLYGLVNQFAYSTQQIASACKILDCGNEQNRKGPFLRGAYRKQTLKT